MMSAIAALFYAVILVLLDLGVNENLTNQETLILVHTIFRHGERTVDLSTLYPNDPYINETYYPYGVGQLTNAGKKREYNLGKALRKRYDSFLGNIYEPDLLEAQTTDFNRTKMSLELVLAGMFPPVGDQIFEPALLWQPIPYNYQPVDKDKILLGTNCPNYAKFYNKLTNSNTLKKEFAKRKILFKYLSLHSGWNITNYGDVFYLYFGLRSEEEWGFNLPEWTNTVYPKQLEDMVIKEYYIATGSRNLRKLAAGTLKPPRRKLFLYSGHESNIAGFLSTLDIFEPQIPPYGCYILLEIHLVDGVYGIMIYYQDYIGDDPKLLKLPSCEEFCPFDQFISIVVNYLPSEDLCGDK
ncbi:hypothetical protein NQ317_011934 [Molorchus minor]|uniref:acid phosphatase n=1 Tax=Molorchus minor TaxID=1323400 RepID=A0ABQ9IW67_9CUCU|nr:hypothetical protein NQ317_011934 [Molorchus minor]